MVVHHDTHAEQIGGTDAQNGYQAQTGTLHLGRGIGATRRDRSNANDLCTRGRAAGRALLPSHVHRPLPAASPKTRCPTAVPTGAGDEREEAMDRTHLSRMTRRNLIRGIGLGLAATAVAACPPALPPAA